MGPPNRFYTASISIHTYWPDLAPPYDVIYFMYWICFCHRYSTLWHQASHATIHYLRILVIWIHFKENAIGSVFCKMPTILSKPWCQARYIISHRYCPYLNPRLFHQWIPSNDSFIRAWLYLIWQVHASRHTRTMNSWYSLTRLVF